MNLETLSMLSGKRSYRASNFLENMEIDIVRIVCFLLFLFLSVSLTADSFSRDTDHERILINVFSKHLRLLREKKISSLRLNFLEGVFISNERTGESHVVVSLKVLYRSGRYFLVHNSGENFSEGEYLCKSLSEKKYFNIKINDIERKYPLPLNIKMMGKTLDFIVSEEIKKYSLDSAIAELGHVKNEESEALYALYNVILARSQQKKIQLDHQHGKYHFCDLTHCQVYKGQLNSQGYDFNNSEWFIDSDNKKRELLFHSSCGGETLGMKVFDISSDNSRGVKDILYRFNYKLCKPLVNNWKREIEVKELFSILQLPSQYGPGNTSIVYDRENCHIKIESNSDNQLLSPESFRLAINRKKGWNFLKSNNYVIGLTGDRECIVLKGRGLGHCNGLCQHGSLELARLGYSRYEILEHYYPWIKLTHVKKKPDIPPYLSYCIFDIFNGEILKTSSPAFLKRKFPPGSLWKLIVSLYLAKERPDIINNYHYNCKGLTNDKNMPKKCWDSKGHGNLNFSNALSLSCNLYFASLYNNINKDKFYSYYRNFCRINEITYYLPELNNKQDWSFLLSGLDFSLTSSVNDLIKLSRIINVDGTNGPSVERFKAKIPINLRIRIMDSLFNAFVNGTAKTSYKRYGDKKNNYTLFENENNINILNKPLKGIWGKTSTMIDGTNKPMAYGVFMGGLGHKGIIVVLRKGNGYLASQWGKVKLIKFSNK